ncbi:hypothetical protein AWH62_08610 [Maricaulis sp. W15]|uniref:hypothetical protein n=1 Tax=Maricaulis sp. W15 TaxID=1772333 RepID=UPI000948EEBE|nr:hypothetical protein [Maricaulis sp. W15]OLF73006.1 hypothetical protein AWH62_08610 [Maricaulis sp. W15]
MPVSRTGYAFGIAAALVIQGSASAAFAQPSPESVAPSGDGSAEIQPSTEPPLTDAEQALLDQIRAAGPIEPNSDRPCPFGTYGPPLNVRDPDAGESGIEIFDPCGLRFTDLSGIWEMSGGFQLIAYHERRGGELAMRFTHVDADHDYYQIWRYMFGDDWLLGQVAPNLIDLVAVIRFPERIRETCPDQWETPYPVHAVFFGYTDTGQVRIGGSRIRNNLSTSCETSYIETVTDVYVRTEAGVRSWTD